MPELPLPNIEKDYDLLQVFLKVGKCLFPNDWHGQNELTVHKRKDVDELINKKTEIQGKIDKAEKQLAEIMEKRDASLNEGEINRLGKLYGEKLGQISTLSNELVTLPDIENYERNNELLDRREKAEKIIIEAIKNKELTIWSFGGLPECSEVWNGQKGYRFDFGLSLIWFPKKQGLQNRRFFIRLHHRNFDDWLNHAFPSDENDQFQSLTPLQQCEIALQAIAEEASSRRVKLLKRIVIPKLMKAFSTRKTPTHKLFEDERNVPNYLKYSGPPPSDADKGEWIAEVLKRYLPRTAD